MVDSVVDTIVNLVGEPMLHTVARSQTEEKYVVHGSPIVKRYSFFLMVVVVYWRILIPWLICLIWQMLLPLSIVCRIYNI